MMTAQRSVVLINGPALTGDAFRYNYATALDTAFRARGGPVFTVGSGNGPITASHVVDAMQKAAATGLPGTIFINTPAEKKSPACTSIYLGIRTTEYTRHLFCQARALFGKRAVDFFFTTSFGGDALSDVTELAPGSCAAALAGKNQWVSEQDAQPLLGELRESGRLLEKGSLAAADVLTDFFLLCGSQKIKLSPCLQVAGPLPDKTRPFIDVATELASTYKRQLTALEKKVVIDTLRRKGKGMHCKPLLDRMTNPPESFAPGEANKRLAICTVLAAHNEGLR